MPLLHIVLDFKNSKTMHLVNPREKPSYGISDLYKQWPQKQESNRNYPQVSSPSAAPGEPPQFLSTQTEFKTFVGILYLFFHQLQKNWSSFALFVLRSENYQPAVVWLSHLSGACGSSAECSWGGGRMSKDGRSRGTSRGEKRLCLSAVGSVSLKALPANEISLSDWKQEEQSTWACVFDWGKGVPSYKLWPPAAFS